MSGVHKLVSVELDTVTLPAATAEIEHERRVAIFDLVEKNSFEPVGADSGPYKLKLSLQDNRLVFDIEGEGFTRTYAISLTPLKGVLRDYLMICDSYYEALRGSSASQIESVDMGRRGLHNEGADQLKSRLDGKILVDHETARRLFTLLCALYRRG
ncbi:MAG: UPF0262 family protein [Brevundimonas sp.]|jgi:uncharacterized protein (UPF0262 family)|uniref:UPF0262 protein GGR11_000936 n=1 Tax=Brevundimonas mediterranea TaxID=74329 RepID=A0A7W6EZG9_9CAUL|nr:MULTISPECIES: UPF0262 family protein [Brevundimonas]MBB3871422.1 uncharacterized protein (UPF0262 family) [Brevundimonas mediterranea]MDK2746315.1 UPF0262 family protein [Brevundimonas sp.]